MPIKELCVLKNQSYLNLSQKKEHFYVLVLVILKLNVLIKPKMCIHVTEVLKQCNSIAYLSSICLFHLLSHFFSDPESYCDDEARGRHPVPLSPSSNSSTFSSSTVSPTLRPPPTDAPSRSPADRMALLDEFV